MIPEAVIEITAVSSLKTVEFQNSFALYSYKKVREDLIFGYELKPFRDRVILFAYPEKALLDLLYLYPFYDSHDEMKNLRLDEEYMANHLNIASQKYMVKEYIQLMVLDWLSTSTYVQKVVFIGGTNLRLVKGIDRFSEDLDFDCKDFSQEEFTKMTDEVLIFLQRARFFFPFII